MEIDSCIIPRAEEFSKRGYPFKASDIYSFAAKCAQRDFRNTGLFADGERTYLFRKHAARAVARTNPLLAAAYYRSAAKAASRLFTMADDPFEKLKHISNCAADANAAAELFFPDLLFNTFSSLGFEAYALMEMYALTRNPEELERAELIMRDICRFDPEKVMAPGSALNNFRRMIPSLNAKLEEALKS
jgi:hypothetical protein